MEGWTIGDVEWRGTLKKVY